MKPKEAPGTVHSSSPFVDEPKPLTPVTPKAAAMSALLSTPGPTGDLPIAPLTSDGTKKQEGGHGGKRANQLGRPIGVKDKLSIADILTNIQRESGMSYAEVLARDFQEARDAGDRGAVTKYHSLILTRVAPSLQNLEIKDSTANMEAKAYAFVEAIKEVVEKEQGNQ